MYTPNMSQIIIYNAYMRVLSSNKWCLTMTRPIYSNIIGNHFQCCWILGLRIAKTETKIIFKKEQAFTVKIHI